MIDTINKDAANWLRNVLSNAIGASPIQRYARDATDRLIHRLPDSLLLRWSEVNGIDAVAASHSSPELPALFLSDAGRMKLKQYMEAFRVRPLIQRVRRMVSAVDRLDGNGKLPCEYSEVVHATAAVALANRTADGRELLVRVASILDTSKHADAILATYEQLLTSANRPKVSQVHEILDCDYGDWVWSRLEEALEWLKAYQPAFRIWQGERTALWDALWVTILTGGDLR